MATVLCWAGTALRAVRRPAPRNGGDLGEGTLARAGHRRGGDGGCVAGHPPRSLDSVRRGGSGRNVEEPLRVQDGHLHRLRQELLRDLLGRRRRDRSPAGAVSVPGQSGPRGVRLLVPERLPVQPAVAAGVPVRVVPAGQVAGRRDVRHRRGAAGGGPSHHADHRAVGRVRLPGPVVFVAGDQERARSPPRTLGGHPGDALDEPVHARRDPVRGRAVHAARGGAAAGVPIGRSEPPAPLRVPVCADAGLSRAAHLAGRTAGKRAGTGSRRGSLQPRAPPQQHARILPARSVTVQRLPGARGDRHLAGPGRLPALALEPAPAGSGPPTEATRDGDSLRSSPPGCFCRW